MIKTEKKYWSNGWSLRGGFYNAYALNIFNLGIIIYWSSQKDRKVKQHLYFYKLIK